MTSSHTTLLLHAALVSGVCLAAPRDARAGSNENNKKTHAPATSSPCLRREMRHTSERTWEMFREGYPLHIQGFVYEHPEGSECATLIAAEPPPHVTVNSLRRSPRTEALRSLLGNEQIMTHRQGFDGWVRDVVYTLPPLNQEQQDELLSALYYEYYTTSYKWRSGRLPLAPKGGTRDLNLAPRPRDFKPWLSRPAHLYFSLDGTGPKTLQDISSDPVSRVYLSDDTLPGLVVWSIPLHSESLDLARAVRQFGIEADIIVGAARSSIPGGNLVVFGRRRATDLSDYPAIRAETIQILLPLNASEYGQSFERGDKFAHRYYPGDGSALDWAPTFLSHPFTDSEFGGLLHASDVILKSWSEAVVKRYPNYETGGPNPPIFVKPLRLMLMNPFGCSNWMFPHPLICMLTTRDGSLRYNWNLDHMEVLSDRVQGFDVFTMGPTGSLSVLYEVNGERRFAQLEDRAHERFSTNSHAALVKTAQYVTLLSMISWHRTGTGSRLYVGSHDREQGRMAKQRDLEFEQLMIALGGDEVRVHKEIRARHESEYRQIRDSRPKQWIRTIHAIETTTVCDDTQPWCSYYMSVTGGHTISLRAPEPASFKVRSYRSWSKVPPNFEPSPPSVSVSQGGQAVVGPRELAQSLPGPIPEGTGPLKVTKTSSGYELKDAADYHAVYDTYFGLVESLTDYSRRSEHVSIQLHGFSAAERADLRSTLVVRIERNARHAHFALYSTRPLLSTKRGRGAQPTRTLTDKLDFSRAELKEYFHESETRHELVISKVRGGEGRVKWTIRVKAILKNGLSIARAREVWGKLVGVFKSIFDRAEPSTPQEIIEEASLKLQKELRDEMQEVKGITLEFDELGDALFGERSDATLNPYSEDLRARPRHDQSSFPA